MIGTLYGGPLTLPTSVVRVVLAEKSLPFNFVEVPWSPVEGYRPVHPMIAKYHPDQRNPVWVDDDGAFYDSFLICTYLEDRYDPTSNDRQHAAQRAKSRSLFFDANRYLFPLIENLVQTRVYGSSSSPADAPRVERGLEVFARRTKQAKALGHYHLDAHHPSLGDLAAATLLNGYAFLAGGLPVACNELVPWLTRMQQRPSLQSVFNEMQVRVSELMPTFTGSHP
ncbi:MAG: glutathione S-transferase family protein [Rhodobiaceae bacterium]|nr:glutathione S-transferase family protein [Rhodobiaceae bacterium]